MYSEVGIEMEEDKVLKYFSSTIVVSSEVKCNKYLYHNVFCEYNYVKLGFIETIKWKIGKITIFLLNNINTGCKINLIVQ